MANSIENRVPFMDNDLVDFAMKCPVNLKLKNLGEAIKMNENQSGNKSNIYYKKTHDGKQILRKMMAPLIPNEIIQSAKQGFSSPDASWFRGESIEFVKRTLIDSNPKIYTILDRNAIAPLLDEHLSGKQNRRLLIWSLLNVEAWMQDNL